MKLLKVFQYKLVILCFSLYSTFSLGSQGETVFIPIAVGGITTVIPILPTPDQVQLNTVGIKGQYPLSWSSVSGVQYYQIKIINDIGEITIVEVSSANYTLAGLALGDNKIEIKACNGAHQCGIAVSAGTVSVANRITYMHSDILGTPVMESDAAGRVVNRSTYEPFGKRMQGNKSGIGYTGHIEDEALSLVYMQARYYDPVVGRFYSNDPVDFSGHKAEGNAVHGFNRYVYANNNPYKYIDPNGEAPIGINTGGSATFLGKGSLSSMVLFDPDTLELAFVTNQEIGAGGGKGAGLFFNAVWTTDDITIDDFAGTGTSVSGSASVVNGSVSLPDSHHGVEVSKNVALNGAESPGHGAIMEAGVAIGVGAEGGVTRTNSQVYKTTIITDVVNEVKSWID
ncbi:RHS repeat-associated core domain-containing protein [Pseudoalteromonas sp. OOF1S-7]|uniref:RHS repeat-associated core domain-containing protein n=1 Tax=Pseudoalteromonas sp. OOF1S-7 TaxID=2917757 RepID=UPI001EF71172|nr:RHS repeat-associated core domain-containing protein [Pseudoalteromonas sp. OOF1S-7]MCG7537559.1 hypothetical protein [Pseudoalteromonas sp. OOF1S-7]